MGLLRLIRGEKAIRGSMEVIEGGKGKAETSYSESQRLRELYSSHKGEFVEFTDNEVEAVLAQVDNPEVDFIGRPAEILNKLQELTPPEPEPGAPAVPRPEVVNGEPKNVGDKGIDIAA